MSIQSLSPHTKRLNRTKQILPETILKRESNFDKQYLSLGEQLYANNKCYSLDHILNNDNKLKTNITMQMRYVGVMFKKI